MFDCAKYLLFCHYTVTVYCTPISLVTVKKNYIKGYSFFKNFYLERGRPPKVFSNELPEFGGGDGLDSPPKAKRKSRPPRRHKPDYDPREEGIVGENGDTMMVGVGGVQIFAGIFHSRYIPFFLMLFS